MSGFLSCLVRRPLPSRHLLVGCARRLSDKKEDPSHASTDLPPLNPDELAAELSKAGLKSSHLFSDLNDFREDIPSIAKCLFTGSDFPYRILSYPDVLPNDRYFDLERRYYTVK